MNDIFTLKSVPITPEIGIALKSFRIENKITATSIVNYFSKSASYINKLENGEIKKIEGELLIELCNYITQTDDGLHTFLQKISKEYLNYTPKTQLIIQNIDELLVSHAVTDHFIDLLNSYLQEKNISVQELTKKINANEDIEGYACYDIAPQNIWYMSDPTLGCYSNIIKLNVPQSYIDDLLNKKILNIHYVIAYAILYSLYRLGKDNDSMGLTHIQLKTNGIEKCVTIHPQEQINNYLKKYNGGLDSDSLEILNEITTSINLIMSATKKDGYGIRRAKQINENLNKDLGFSFAFMSSNLDKLLDKNTETKQEFLNDLKSLIDKYANTETKLEMRYE